MLSKKQSGIPSSTSSYAATQNSSTFTSSSTTDISSASSYIFLSKSPQYQQRRHLYQFFPYQVKKLYRSITSLETKGENAETEKNPRYNGRLPKDKDLTQEGEQRGINGKNDVITSIIYGAYSPMRLLTETHSGRPDLLSTFTICLKFLSPLPFPCENSPMVAADWFFPSSNCASYLYLFFRTLFGFLRRASPKQ
ncbi:hypothetical protein GYMLUDRAFT_262315 [Collybiopsis luxurians FD-317 M1]|uniref:Uncharacterized protein n=1 Tax=Collybiopsis luxurians FD-317 M1 TaxID=944289 RepID=A0A0D0CSN6_9AGAR|nr:hypothetical protein GYMLUDRAFT_262315 [Collybiopsis luxurians FD-317 M1]